MKKLLVVVGMMLAAGMAAQADLIALPRTSPSKETEALAKSATVREKGAEFAILTAPVWPVPAKGKETPVTLGVKITNHNDGPMRFNRFDTVTVILKTADGKWVERSGGRNGTLRVKPVTVGKDESYTLEFPGHLAWAKDGTLRLEWSEPGGGTWQFLNLKAGKFTLEITYENTPDLARWVADEETDKTAPSFWFGKAAMELAVEIRETPRE